jgi:hypothetical protein
MGTQFHPEWMTHLNWVMGLFSSFIDASRIYSSIPREGIDPFFEEISGWLRQRDRSLYPRNARAALNADPRISRHGLTFLPEQEI